MRVGEPKITTLNTGARLHRRYRSCFTKVSANLFTDYKEAIERLLVKFQRIKIVIVQYGSNSKEIYVLDDFSLKNKTAPNAPFVYTTINLMRPSGYTLSEYKECWNVDPLQHICCVQHCTPDMVTTVSYSSTELRIMQ